MTPEEQRSFDRYVQHRRDMYPWSLFFAVVVPAVVVAVLVITFAIKTALQGAP